MIENSERAREIAKFITALLTKVIFNPNLEF